MPRSRERLALLMNDIKTYIAGLDVDDIDALLINLSKTEGLTAEEASQVQDWEDEAPEWLKILEKASRE